MSELPHDPADPQVRRAEERVGRRLKDKWRLDALLGIGGMATVYAATHRNGNRVAIKTLHVELSADEGIRSRFLREGYAANSVEHPGAVRVLDDDIAEDGSVFLVMELLQGESLTSRWERLGRRLPWNEVVSIGDQLLDVLASAHDRGIVHRDIKPDNVFLSREGVVKVLDFGIARVREMSQGSPSATRTGTAMGTPAFMPPEQALGRTDLVDARSDLWAVGATLFTLLCGRYVHEGRTANEILVYAATRPATPLAALTSAIPAGVAAIVDRALAFNQADRWPDARSMQDALRGFQARPSARRASETDLAATVLAGAGAGERAGAGAGERAGDGAGAYGREASPASATLLATPGVGLTTNSAAVATRSATGEDPVVLPVQSQWPTFALGAAVVLLGALALVLVRRSNKGSEGFASSSVLVAPSASLAAPNALGAGTTALEGTAPNDASVAVKVEGPGAIDGGNVHPGTLHPGAGGPAAPAVAPHPGANNGLDTKKGLPRPHGTASPKSDMFDKL